MTRAATPPPRRTRAIDLQMRPIRWAGKGQSREARLFRALRAELVKHVGGKPSAAQTALINRCAMLQTHLARMDEKVFGNGEMSDHASRQYLAWANATSRMLQALGLHATRAKALTADDSLKVLRERYSIGAADAG